MSQKEIRHTPRPSGAHSSEEEMREGPHIKLLWVKTLPGIRMSGKVEKREKRESWMSPWIRQHLPFRTELWKEHGTGEGENGRG